MPSTPELLSYSLLLLPALLHCEMLLLLSPGLSLLPVSLLAMSLEAQSQSEPLVKITHSSQVPGIITTLFIIASDASFSFALQTLTVLGACDFRGTTKKKILQMKVT